MLASGPSIGQPETLTLKVEATGWPLPTYQWYRDDVALPGETTAELQVHLFCPTDGANTYRCIRCKMVSKAVPVNAFHVKCGNCSHEFTYKDVRSISVSNRNGVGNAIFCYDL